MSKFLLEPKCAPGQVLDVDGAKTDNETNIHIWELGQGIHQYFKFIDAGDNYAFIEACHCPGKVLDVKNSEVKNCTNIQLYEKNNTDAQKFKKVDAGDGYYIFKSKLNENFCIDVDNSGKNNGTNIWLYECNGSDAQKFKLINNLDAAIIYAKKYAFARNPKYKNYEGRNCANFCSQCLVAGGVPTDDEWHNEKYAFINTLYLKDYFCKKGIQFIEKPNINDVNKGDIAYSKGGSGNFGHVMFVIDKIENNVVYCGNTNDRCGYSININSLTGVLKTDVFFK